MVSDPSLETFNLDAKVAAFVKAVLEEWSSHRGQHIMIKMGSDFAWDNVSVAFCDLFTNLVNLSDLL